MFPEKGQWPRSIDCIASRRRYSEDLRAFVESDIDEIERSSGPDGMSDVHDRRWRRRWSLSTL